MHDLVVAAGRNHAGRRRLRAFLIAHQHLDLGAERLLVELDRLLAAAVEEQIRCRHGLLSFVQVVWDRSFGISRLGSRCAGAMRRVQAACARRSAAMSILRILSIDRMTRCAVSEFPSISISGRALWQTCHERPNLSLSQPQWPASPSFPSVLQKSSVSSCVPQGTWNDSASLNLKCGPPFSARNFCPSISNSTVMTVPAFLPWTSNPSFP